MSRYILRDLARRQRNIRRRRIVLRDIAPPAVLASDLYAACYAPVVALWQNATDRIVGTYARSLAEVTTDSPADLTADLDAADAEFQRLLFLITPQLNTWALRVESWFRGKWRGAVLSATGVDLQTMLGPQDVRASLETHIQWNNDLIRDVSAEARRRIGAAVFDGLRNRSPARDVAAKVREATGFARDRSRRIASDQLAKLTSALADERRREAGIDRWRWRHSGKLHFRPEHKARDGKVYADTAAGAGENALAPPEDRPGQLPYCGCRALACLIFE